MATAVETKPCAVCGSPIERDPAVAHGHWVRRKYCGPTCAEHAHRRQRSVRKPPPAPKRPDRRGLCECGQPYTTTIQFFQLGRIATLPVCADCKRLHEEIEEDHARQHHRAA